MNLTRKLKALAVAVVAATASQMSFASLLHANPSTGNGSFFFVASDDEGDSYIQSLSNGNGNFRLDSADPITAQTFTLGTGLGSILAGSNPVWAVIAGDSLAEAGTTYPGLRASVTVTTDTTTNGGPSAVRNAALLQGLQFLNAFLGTVDGSLVTVAGNGVFDPGPEGNATDPANFQIAGPSYSLNRLPTETAPLQDGAALDSWLFETVIPTNPNFVAINFGKVTQQGQWTIKGNALTYGVAASPVPVPAAVWLLGSAALGLGRARRRKA